MSEKPKSIQIYRKLWHMSAAWVPLVYYHFIDRYIAIIVVGIAVILALILDIVRLTLPNFNQWFHAKLHLLIREDERKTLNTSTWFVIAIFLTIVFFEKQVAVVALLFLAFGDPMAAVIGSQYGTRKFLNKSLQGSMACFIACFVLAQMMFPLHIAFWAALCATLFELLSSKINDNLSIPFFSGMAITLLMKQPEISPPLRFALVVFQVYLIFVIASFLLGIVLRHVIIWLYRRTYSKDYPESDYAPSVSILKPVKGLDDRCYDNFARFCTQEYDGDYEIIFAVEDANDEIVPVINKLIADFPTRSIKIVVSSPTDLGRHGKIRNLIAAQRAASYEISVVSDSDVRPSPNYLSRLIAPLKDDKVGLVTAVPVYFGAKNLAAAMESLITFFLSFTIYYPLAYLEKLETAVGSTLALRRKVLEEIGGFEVAADHIADDHILAGEIHRRGYKIVLTERPVHIHKERDTIRSWLSEVHRRNVMFHAYKPQVYPFYLFQSGIFHGFLYWMFFPSWVATALFSLTMIAEIVSFMVLNKLYVQDLSTHLFFWLIPPLSLIGPVLWFSPFLSSVITWRGNKYYVAKNGIVTQLQTPVE